MKRGSSALTLMVLSAAGLLASPGKAYTGNPWFPLVPGTTYLYDGASRTSTFHTELTVTPQTRRILGVDCKVIQEDDFVDGVLRERTFDWYYEDTVGNVWYYGEDTTQYDPAGNPTGKSGSWEAGVDGALPGLFMAAEPASGLTYAIEDYPTVAEDQFKALRLNASVVVPYGVFWKMCLMAKEWSPLESGEIEHKYYAPGVGLVQIQELTGARVRMDLVDVITGS